MSSGKKVQLSGRGEGPVRDWSVTVYRGRPNTRSTVFVSGNARDSQEEIDDERQTDACIHAHT